MVPKGTIRPKGHGEEPFERARGTGKPVGRRRAKKKPESRQRKAATRRLESQSRKAANESKLLDSGVPELLAAGCRISY